MAAIRGHFQRGTDPYFLYCYQLAMYQVSCFYHKMHDSSQNCYISAPLFVHKGIELINLPSIFKDKSVISSIPTYFENKESPIICYRYNKPIRSTVFNYNKLVTELDIENSTPDS